MGKIKGTPEGDDLLGTEQDDTLDGYAGNDQLTDLEGNDLIRPGPDNDTLAVGFGRDRIEIEPGGGHDRIMGFTSANDTLVFKNFPTLDHFDDLRPYFTVDPEAVSVTLDVSASAGGTPGEQTLTFMYTTDLVHRHDVEFDQEPLGIDPNATVTPVVPQFPPDPSRFDLKTPEAPGLVEYGFTDEGPYVQPFEDPLWGVIH